MARVSKPLVLSEGDLVALQELSSYGNKDASLRAEIIIACANDRTNKSIAQELSINETTVKKWKEIYREKGMQGLVSEYKGGRRPSSPTPADLEQTILGMLADCGNGNLTASEIASQLKVDVGKVYYVLRKNGITLERNTTWEYISRDDMGTWDPPIIGLYLSPSCSCIVTSSNPWSKENGTMQGVFVTRDKALEDELERSCVPVSLSGIIRTAAGMPAAMSGRMPEPEAVIEDAIAQWDRDREAEFSVFCFGNAFSYEGTRSKQSRIYHHSSLDEMKSSFLHWMGGRCNADQHAKAEHLLTEICRFCRQQSDLSNAFVWYLCQNETGHDKTGTEKGISAFDAFEKSEGPLVLPEAKNWTSVEEMLNALLPEMNSSTHETEAGAILYHRGKDGMIHYSHVLSKQKFQAMEEFSFESKDDFERDLSRLEEDTEGFLREVAGANYEMFLSGAKKTKSDRSVLKSRSRDAEGKDITYPSC